MSHPRLGPVFVQLWLGEWVIAFGSALLSFALGVWVFQQTGSAQKFSLAIVTATLPALLLMPVAGSLADRVARRWIIAACDGAFLLISLVLVLLLWFGRLQVGHLYVLNGIGALAMAARMPASQAVLASVVPGELLARANGLLGLSLTVSQLAAPLLAGALMVRGGLGTVLPVVLALCSVGATMVFAALSRARLAPAAPAQPGASLPAQVIGSMKASLSFFRRRPAMLQLLAYTSIQKGLLTLVASMMMPLVLSTHSSKVLGVVMTLAAAGGVAGSITLAVINVQRRLVVWVLLLDAFLSMCVVTTGLATSPLVWGGCAFLAAFAGAMSEGCAGALWMRQTPAASQAGVLSLVGMNGLFTVSLVMLAGGMVSEHLLEPAMSAGGAWSATLGPWLGTGKGRGLALLFVLCGSACLLISMAALAGLRARRGRAPALAAGSLPQPDLSSPRS